MAGRDWADCSAAPALLYADWVHPIGPERANVRAYRQRLLARPYRPLFPPGAPDRD